MASEWIEFNRPFSRYDYDCEDDEKVGFEQEMADVDTAGLLIELEDGKQHLIGTINRSGGCCGCCGLMSGSDIVVRYRRVCEPPTRA